MGHPQNILCRGAGQCYHARQDALTGTIQENMGHPSFGSWSAAVNIFSQVANNPGVQMVSTMRGIATFYGASIKYERNTGSSSPGT